MQWRPKLYKQRREEREERKEIFPPASFISILFPQLCGFAKVMRAYLNENSLDRCGCTLNKEKIF